MQLDVLTKKNKKTKTNGIILNRDTFEIYVPFQR